MAESSGERGSGETTRLGPDDLFALQYIRGGCLSPDGRWVAYAVSRTEQSEHFQIWVAEIATGKRQPLPHPGNATAPAWCPDGSRIAFVADGRLRVAEFPSLSVSDPLTPAEHSVEGAIAWSPDSRRIAVSLSRRRVVEGPRRLVARVFRVDGMGFLDDWTQQIHEIVLQDGSSRCLTAADDYCSQPEWSPCGRKLLFLSRREVVSRRGCFL